MKILKCYIKITPKMQYPVSYSVYNVVRIIYEFLSQSKNYHIL